MYSIKTFAQLSSTREKLTRAIMGASAHEASGECATIPAEMTFSWNWKFVKLGFTLFTRSVLKPP